MERWPRRRATVTARRGQVLHPGRHPFIVGKDCNLRRICGGVRQDELRRGRRIANCESTAGIRLSRSESYQRDQALTQDRSDPRDETEVLRAGETHAAIARGGDPAREYFSDSRQQSQAIDRARVDGEATGQPALRFCGRRRRWQPVREPTRLAPSAVRSEHELVTDQSPADYEDKQQ